MQSVGWLRSRGSSGQALVETPEFLVAVVLDDDPTAAPRSGEADLRAEGAPKVVRDTLEIGVGAARRRAGRVRLRFTQAATSSSVWRTDSSWPTTESRTRSCSSVAQAPEGPAVALRQTTIGDRGLDAGRESRSRSVFATVERARPTRVATSSWLNPNSSISWR